MPSRSARWQPETGAFGGWAELRLRERKPLMYRALCRLIPAVMNQSPAVDQVCRIATFGRDNHASKARTCAGEWADYLFFDVTSICQRLFMLATSPDGERSVGGRVRRCRDGAHQTTRRCRSRPLVRSRLTLHQPTRCASSAHSVFIYYSGVFFKFRTCTYAVRGTKFDRNILSRMDLNFSENSINNTVVRTARHEPASLYEAAFFPNGSSGGLVQGTIGIVRTILNGCSLALIPGAVTDSRAVHPGADDASNHFPTRWRFPAHD